MFLTTLVVLLIFFPLLEANKLMTITEMCTTYGLPQKTLHVTDSQCIEN